MDIIELKATDLAAMLCSRVCHDLINPIGAIGNGLEVLGDPAQSEMAEGARDLIASAAKQSRDIYARLLSIGITAMIGCQALLNFFAVLGMAPLTGVPLPFISYGGCNLIIMLAAMGLLINVASGRHQARVKVLRGGAKGSRPRTAHQAPRKVAAAGGAPTRRSSSRGHYEDRGRRGGNGGSRRSGPRSR